MAIGNQQLTIGNQQILFNFPMICATIYLRNVPVFRQKRRTTLARFTISLIIIGFTFTQLSNAEIDPESIVSAWLFDETSGKVAKDSSVMDSFGGFYIFAYTYFLYLFISLYSMFFHKKEV